MTAIEDRTDYRTPHAIARYWVRDGKWHILQPVSDPVTGLATGRWRYTDGDPFPTRSEAIAVIDASA